MVFEDKSLAPYHGREPFIFISYSHRNSDQAAEIISTLNRAGFRVWYDEGLIPGREWDENIARIIMGCSYFIALLTEEYLASSNCKDELNYARDKNKPIVLIYLDEVTLPAGMELRLGRLFAGQAVRGEEMTAAVSLEIGVQITYAPDFTRTRVVSVVKFTVDNQAHADPCSEGDAGQGGGVFLFEMGIGAEGEAVGVVVDADRHAEMFLENRLQGHILPGRDVDGVIDQAGLPVQGRGDSQADACHVLGEAGTDEALEDFQSLLQRGILGEGVMEGRVQQEAGIVNPSDSDGGSTYIYTKPHASICFGIRTDIQYGSRAPA